MIFPYRFMMCDTFQTSFNIESFSEPENEQTFQNHINRIKSFLLNMESVNQSLNYFHLFLEKAERKKLLLYL